MKIFRFIFLLIILISTVISASAQILNIEQERIKTDTTGWAGSAKISFQFTKTDEELWTGGAYTHVQYKTKRSLYLSLTEYNLNKCSGSDFVNAGAQHFRYNYKFKDYFIGELFTQFQFNKVLEVKFRWLLGAGPRIRIVNTKPFMMHIAALYMYEHEELYNSDLINRNHRMSSYVAFTYKIHENLSLINTSYFQPKINDFSDFRVLSQSDLKISISKHFSFLLSYLYTYDTFPATGVPKNTHYLGNSLTYEF